MDLVNEVENIQSEIKKHDNLKKDLRKLKEENILLRERFSNILKSNLKDHSHVDSYLIESYQSQIVNCELEKMDISNDLAATKDHLRNSLEQMDELKRKNQELMVRNGKQETLIESLYREANLFSEIQGNYENKCKETDELRIQIDIKTKQYEAISKEMNELRAENADIIQNFNDNLREKDCRIRQLNTLAENYYKNQLEYEKRTIDMKENMKNVNKLTAQIDKFKVILLTGLTRLILKF